MMSGRFVFLVFLSVIGSSLLAAPKPTDCSPETPYHWRVVVRMEQHPLFTDRFRAGFFQDLRAGLQPMLGEAGLVEVVDLDRIPKADWLALWTAWDKDGFPALEREEFRTLTGIKTHILKIRVGERARIHLEARQHDGATGLTSPRVRTRTADSPEILTRFALMTLSEDFGAVGVVEREPNEVKTARIRLRGYQLQRGVGQVKVDDVFAFAVIFRQPESKLAERGRPAVEVWGGKPQEFTLFRVKAVLPDGLCPCEVITRFQKPFVGGRDVIGYRAMKLTTRKAPLNLRLVNQEGEPPDRRNALQLWATDSTFTNSPTPRDSLDGLGGKYRSGRPLEGIACVVVRLGAGRREPFPVPILGDDHTVTLRMAMSEQELARADHEQACEQLRGRALEALSAQLEIYKGLAKLIQEGENEKALKRAAAGLARATADLKDLQAELERLKADPTQDEISKRMLASAAEQVQLLAQAQPELEKKLTDLRAAVAKANDPIALEQEFRVGELTRQIGYHVGRGEIPEALELYDQLFEVTQQEQAKTLKQALIEQWKPKNDAVKTAREFLQEKWRKASTSEELETYLKEFPDHVATLAREDDRLGIRNAISSIQISYARLKEALDRLDENSETDRAAVAKIKKLSDSIRKVEETALAARDRLEPKKE